MKFQDIEKKFEEFGGQTFLILTTTNHPFSASKDDIEFTELGLFVKVSSNEMVFLNKDNIVRIEVRL